MVVENKTLLLLLLLLLLNLGEMDDIYQLCQKNNSFVISRYICIELGKIQYISLCEILHSEI